MVGDEGCSDGREQVRMRYDHEYEASWTMLRGRALALTRDGAAAEDVAQEAFERLWSRSRGGWWPDNAGGWLSRVATNLAISHRRRDEVANRGLATIEAQGGGPGRHAQSAEDTWLGHEDVRVAVGAWRTLPADAQEAVRLAGLGYSGAAIAERLGRTEVATRTLICRSRNTLRVRSELAGGASAAGHVIPSRTKASVGDTEELDTSGHFLALRVSCSGAQAGRDGKQRAYRPAALVRRLVDPMRRWATRIGPANGASALAA